jgi:hypothetical protein
MDTSTIDQTYGQLQTEMQDVATSVQGLAAKLQTAADGGDANAKDWLLDLKQIALDVKDEQIQVNTLLQAIHAFIDSTNTQMQQELAEMQQQQQQGQRMRPGGFFGGGMGGMGMGMGGGPFGGFLGGGFGRAMEMGAGIGLGEDLINKIF